MYDQQEMLTVTAGCLYFIFFLDRFCISRLVVLRYFFLLVVLSRAVITFFDGRLETLDRRTQVTTDVLQFLGTEDQDNHGQQNQ